MKSIVLIPTWNPDEHLVRKIKALYRDGADEIAGILVVDDGSQERFQYVYRRLDSIGVHVIHHMNHMGRGLSIKSGLDAVDNLDVEYDSIIIAESNGKYTTEEILQVARCMESHPTSVVVAEEEKCKKISLNSKLAAWYLHKKTGMKCANFDSQLKGIPASLSRMTKTIKFNNRDYAKKIILAAAHSGADIFSLDLKNDYSLLGNDYISKSV